RGDKHAAVRRTRDPALGHRRPRPGQGRARPPDAGGLLPIGTRRDRPCAPADPDGLPAMTAKLTFTVSPPGFAPHVDFVLDEVAGAIGLYTLRSVEVGAPRLFVLDAGVYLPAYTPELSD